MLKKNDSQIFEFYTEQGQFISYKVLLLCRIPFCSKSFVKKLVLNKFRKLDSKKDIIVFSAQNFIFSFYSSYNFLLYNGKTFNKFKFINLRVYQRFGSFITTRIVNTGKVLHLRKKNLKKKK